MGVCERCRGRACFEGGVVVTSGMRMMGSAIGMTTTAVPFYYRDNKTIAKCHECDVGC